MEKHLKRFIKSGKTHEEAKALLLSIEPFDKYPQYVESLTEKI